MSKTSAVCIAKSAAKSGLTSPCIQIHVGQDDATKKFSVHQALITGRSEFFARALNGRWEEADEGIVKFPEDDPNTFEMYLQLLYGDVVPFEPTVNIYVDSEQHIKKTQEDLKAEVNLLVGREYTNLSRLYVFCEKVQDLVSKNLVITAFVEQMNKTRLNELVLYPGQNSINIVFEGTVRGDCLRKLFVDLYVWRAEECWWKDKGCNSFGVEFLFDLAVRTREALDQKLLDKPKPFRAADYLEE